MATLFWGLDVGNTHCKVGVIRQQQVTQVYRFRTEREQSLDEYYFQLKNICQEEGLSIIPPLVVSSVVPVIDIALKRLALARGLTIHWIDRHTPFRFSLAKDIVHQVGSDLLIQAEAAVGLKGPDCIIVAAGTATTVFAVRDGILEGGAIAPGIKGSVEALFNKAAMLSPVLLEAPTRCVGQNTEACLRSGVILGFAELVDGLVRRMRKELGRPTMPVIATGGMIAEIVKASSTIEEVYPNLGLKGLADLGERLLGKAQ